MIDFLNEIRDNMPELAKLAESLGTLASKGVSKLGDAMDWALPYIQKGLDYLVNNGDQVASVLAKVAAAVVAMKFAPAAEGLLSGTGGLLFGSGTGGKGGGLFGGIKNLFGTIPGLEKPQLHYLWPDIKDFSRMLVELAQTVSPQLTIIDAIDAMEGNGPTGGTPYPLHMLFAAKDFYTQDYFAAKLMGLNPMEIEMIAQAVDLGLATPDEIELVGDPLPENLKPFRLPDTLNLDFSNYLPGPFGKLFAKFAAKMLKSYPQLNHELCVGCGKCAESCPVKIIEIKDRKAVFKKKGCISCFCCQEMCPMKAISVKKAL